MTVCVFMVEVVIYRGYKDGLKIFFWGIEELGGSVYMSKQLKCFYIVGKISMIFIIQTLDVRKSLRAYSIIGNRISISNHHGLIMHISSWNHFAVSLCVSG